MLSETAYDYVFKYYKGVAPRCLITAVATDYNNSKIKVLNYFRYYGEENIFYYVRKIALKFNKKETKSVEFKIYSPFKKELDTFNFELQLEK